MKRLAVPLLFVFAALNAWTGAAEPGVPKNAAAHRADPRTAAEIQQANLRIQSFPDINRDFAKERAEIPAWWQNSLGERDAFLAAQVKKGAVITYGTSAGGRPLRAVAYGNPRTGRGTTTANGALSFGDIRAWLGPDHAKRVALVFSAIHGGEFEGIVGTMNLLSVLETGADLAGRPQPALAAAAARLDRLIVIPVANPDGRARIPVRMLQFRGGSNHAAEYFNTGAWADGSLIGWPANKEFIPVDFARLQFAGGYFNDAGVNCQQDDFLGQPQPETRALLDLCARERPDLALNLHTGVSMDNYFMGMLHTNLGRRVEAAWAGLYRQTHTALAAAGHRSTSDPAIEADPAKVGPIGPNLDTIINLHANTFARSSSRLRTASAASAATARPRPPTRCSCSMRTSCSSRPPSTISPTPAVSRCGLRKEWRIKTPAGI